MIGSWLRRCVPFRAAHCLSLQSQPVRLVHRPGRRLRGRRLKDLGFAMLRPPFSVGDFCCRSARAISSTTCRSTVQGSPQAADPKPPAPVGFPNCDPGISPSGPPFTFLSTTANFLIAVSHRGHVTGDDHVAPGSFVLARRARAQSRARPGRRLHLAGALGRRQPRRENAPAARRRPRGRERERDLDRRAGEQPAPGLEHRGAGFSSATSWIQPVSSDSGTYTGARNSRTNTGIWISAPACSVRRNIASPHPHSAATRSIRSPARAGRRARPPLPSTFIPAISAATVTTVTGDQPPQERADA